MEGGMRAGSVGDVGELGDEWSFTLYDHEDREILAFVFENEADARKAHKAMQETLARAVALSPAEDRGFVSVPIVRS